MNKYRLRLSKTGTAIYISHLDLMHTLQRAFSRAGLKLKYSEGFNPHPQLSSAMPLSVGTSSKCEIIDFTLTEEIDMKTFPPLMNAVLPQGIEILEVYVPETKVSSIKWLEVEGKLEYDSGDLNDICSELSEFYSKTSVTMLKKSKRGEAETDIRPLIRDINFRARNDAIIVSAFVSANEPVLNPYNIVEAVRQNRPELNPDFAAFSRIETYDEKMEIFR